MVQFSASILRNGHPLQFPILHVSGMPPNLQLHHLQRSIQSWIHRSSGFGCENLSGDSRVSIFLVVTQIQHNPTYSLPHFLISSINFNDGNGILHVYFGNSYVAEFKQTIIHSWYELLSIYGNLAAIVIGGSLISIAELLWFGTGKFSLIWWKRNKVAMTDPNWVFNSSAKRRNTIIAQAIQKNDQGIVYWEEFKQYAQ